MISKRRDEQNNKIAHYNLSPLTEPIADAAPSAADGKLEAVPPSLIGVAAIVSTVAGVVGDHGPPGEGPGGQGEDGDEVDAQTHGQQTNGGTGVGPADHLVEMTDIGLSLLLLELLAEGLDVGREGDDVEVLDPLVLLLELGSATASGGNAAHDVFPAKSKGGKLSIGKRRS